MSCYNCQDGLVYDLLCQLKPYGWLDIKKCAEVLSEAKVDFGDFASYQEEFLHDIGWDSSKQTPDICAIAYDYILQEARQEVEEKISIDILNDLKSEIWVYGNYMCSSFDWSDNQETIDTIKSIPKENRSSTLNWFYTQIDGKDE